jgi:hypothetical protein
MTNHSFDPKDLQLSTDIVASALSKPPKRKIAKTQKATFVKIPYKEGMQIADHCNDALLAVLLELTRLTFIGFGRNPVELSNAKLRSVGVTPESKRKTLLRLEKTGLISVERRGLKAPLVTLKWLPIQP